MTTIKPRSPLAPSTTAAKPTATPATPQEQKPLTGWQQGGVVKLAPSTRQQQHELAIVCPVLAAMVKEGRVPMDKDGNVKFKDLRAAGRELDFSKPMELSLPAIALGGNTPKDLLGNIFTRSFNVLELRSGPAKHAADSAILNSGTFDEARFQAFVAHADGKGRMTLSSFAAAIADQARRDSSGPAEAALPAGKAIALVEYSALLSIFGTKDKATGEVGIPVTQLRDLFQHQRLPPTTGASISESTAIAASMKVKVDANLSMRAFDSTSTITGQAKAGIRLANDEVSTTGAAANAAASAGKAANCPHMNNQAAMPGQVKDAVNAHTSVGLPR